MKNLAVFGIYTTRAAIEKAVGDLRAEGFRSADLSMLVAENFGSKELATEKNSKMPEGAAAGAAAGAVFGGIVGWLAALGTITIAGTAFLAVGPIMGILAGAGAGGTIAGIAGALAGLGLPEFEAKRFEGRLRKGSFLLSVHADSTDWAKKAKEIMVRAGAQDVSTTWESKGEYENTDRPIDRVA